MLKIYNIFFILLISLSLCAQEQEETISKVDKEYEETAHALGLLGSIDTGVGFSYRFIPDRFGFQVSTLPFYVTIGSGFYFQYIGGSFQYRILKGERINVYSYIGTNMGIAFIEGVEIFDHAAGLGVGVDIKLFKKLSLQLQGSYAFNLRDDGVLLGEVRTFFSPGIGLLYNF
jgi:hypothetical protein